MFIILAFHMLFGTHKHFEFRSNLNMRIISAEHGRMARIPPLSEIENFGTK